MAKQISQETFDDVVRENMAEFEMSAEEAVEDAIKQFESQGVNLSIIVKDPKLYGVGEGNETQQHPVIAAINTLAKALEDTSLTDALEESLETLRKECDSDLARRCLAGTNGAYPILYKALSSNKNDLKTLKSLLTAFCSLVNGQPDLIDGEGIELLTTLLKDYRDNPEILEVVVRAIRFNCIKHEGNRVIFVQRNLIIHLTELLTSHKSNPALVKEICICLRALTLDDDVRVPFGKAHENAKTIVTEGDALKAILQLCEEYTSNTSVLAELFLTLSCLAVRNEFCQEVMDRGGLSLITGAFQGGIDDKAIVRQALIVLSSLAANDDVKSEINKLGGVELVVSAMNKHQTNAPIAEAACKVLTSITLRNTDNCRKVIDCQGHQHIVQAMKLHPDNVGVQKNACMALRNLVSRTKEFSECILSLGTEDLLNEAMNQHKEAQDEAKAALRDLGCKVELRELWTGQKGALQ